MMAETKKGKMSASRDLSAPTCALRYLQIHNFKQEKTVGKCVQKYCEQ